MSTQSGWAKEKKSRPGRRKRRQKKRLKITTRNTKRRKAADNRGATAHYEKKKRKRKKKKKTITNRQAKAEGETLWMNESGCQCKRESNRTESSNFRARGFEAQRRSWGQKSSMKRERERRARYRMSIHWTHCSMRNYPRQ